jgi:ppGpp synthetase/RelA/SpoT-type nucleotidyltranferase
MAYPALDEYINWLKKELRFVPDAAARNYYDYSSKALRDSVATSSFWNDLEVALPNLDDEYLLRTGVYLLMSRPKNVPILVKPFTSMIDKSYRRNVLANKHWPDPPDEGWITPENWFERVNDAARTCIVVKYLDGVPFLADKLTALAGVHGYAVETEYQAREEGYYAAHLTVAVPAIIPLRKWDTANIQSKLEIQVTTQLQDVLRVLTHEFYVNRRSKTPTDETKKWQWNYESAEFKANYLAHTLHHMEGLVMDLRGKDKSKDG